MIRFLIISILLSLRVLEINIFLGTYFSNIFNLHYSLKVTDQVVHPNKRTDRY